MADEGDVVVIGLGPGGEDTAGRLAEAGLSVAAVESRLVGGECPYYACVPTKIMVRAAGLLTEGGRVPGMAGDATVRPDWAPVATRIRDEATDAWDDKVAADRLTGKGVRLVRGEGRITAPSEVTVNGQVLRARRGIVLNTGTSPVAPPIDGLADTPYWTNREAVQATEAPESLIVLGGGVVGAEMAQVFSRFDTRVTVVEAADRLLLNEEPESGALLREVFEREGIGVRAGVKVTAVTYENGEFTLRLNGDADQDLSADRLLVATGRRPNLRGLGLAHVGLDENARQIPVDGHMRAAEGVWAIGDITGMGQFTHVSMYQAAIAVRDILGEEGSPASYRAVPRVTFTDPEIASVGLTEAQARDQNLPVRVGMAQIPESSRGWIHKVGNDGFIKLVENTEWGTLVGATAVGPSAGEILGFLAVAVHTETPTAALREMIYAYPTFHRAIEAALADLA
ncbi:pyruvate/2-oxoglutarate dehydrogenase complex dihydrolipoamide dehydrogenase (E3) component [Actinomadura pelletieri DSM 43383]|uniref:Pyruvate/2-oxoglutarate dehydrogenase complex dihydrolipoamide dehydrogenase (E3) component n=1 Tax=Actinomadura pelletieri DSM 43383 TaxID=1120940 RepID=A0A495QIP8_9ACTN|nr:NAD(P)/FAD-dependent oxidoreductase [Actinomadura pelletieri]RKS72018.1 pyruvate/2-oxoglutarate dehydrogenase complex dihydrolipoamide dehydrogenase (E3) component [Actinomadura pelletieri DSM 43383]